MSHEFPKPHATLLTSGGTPSLIEIGYIGETPTEPFYLEGHINIRRAVHEGLVLHYDAQFTYLNSQWQLCIDAGLADGQTLSGIFERHSGPEKFYLLQGDLQHILLENVDPSLLQEKVAQMLRQAYQEGRAEKAKEIRQAVKDLRQAVKD